MKKLIYLFDQRLNLITLVLLFWALFWTFHILASIEHNNINSHMTIKSTHFFL